MRVALAQADSGYDDLDGNLATARQLVRDAAAGGADLVVFPELFLQGYPSAAPMRSDLPITADDPRVLELSQFGPDVAIGMFEEGGVRTYNTTAYLSEGRLVRAQRKMYLVNYLVWDERKHASPGQSLRAFDTRSGRFAVLTCNDTWQTFLPWLVAQDGAEVLLVPANSAVGLGPDSLDLVAYWDGLLTQIARLQQCWVVYVNRVGTQHGARFWGGSRIVSPTGETVVRAPMDEPSLVLADMTVGDARRRRRELPLLADARLGFIAREIDRLIQEGGDA